MNNLYIALLQYIYQMHSLLTGITNDYSITCYMLTKLTNGRFRLVSLTNLLVVAGNYDTEAD